MAAVTEQAKASDPKALQAEVARLRRELATAGKGKAAPAAAAKVVERIPRSVLKQIDAFQTRAGRIAADVGRLQEFAEGLSSALDGYRKTLLSEIDGKPTPAGAIGVVMCASGPHGWVMPRDGVQPAPPPPVQNGTWRAGGGALRSLQALASTMSDGLTWRQVATLAGMKASGGGFGNIKSALRVHGCVEERGDRVYITEVGRAQAGNVDAPLGGPEVVAFWARKLPAKAVRMLEAAIARGQGGIISRAELAAAAEMEPGGGGFGNYVSLIRTNGLVEDRDGGFTAAEVFFR